MNDNDTIDITKEIKKEERKRKWAERKQKVADWWDSNKYYVAIALPIVGSVATKTIRVVGKAVDARKEERLKDLRLYDTSLGHYWELKRKLDNNDWVTINRRRDRGESLGRILDEMNVLK